MDKVLFYVDSTRDNAMRLAVPVAAHLKFLEEAHAGSFAGHFTPRSVHPNDIGGRECIVMCIAVAVDALPVLLMVGLDEGRKLPSSQFQFLAPLRELVLTSCKCHRQSVGIDT